MVVTKRQNIVGNVENLKQVHPSNDVSTKSQVLGENGLHRMLDKRKITKISSAATRYFKIVSYPVECVLSVIAIFYILLFLFPLIVVYNVLKFVEKEWFYFKSGWIAMSGQDALWLQDTKENRLSINSAMVLECSNIEHLVDSIRTIFLRCLTKSENGEPAYARLAKCIHPGIFQYFLKPADNFDINEFVYAYCGPVPKSHDEMEMLISTLSGEELTFNKPWQFIVIPKTYESNEAILLFRAMHGMADGVSLTRFLLEEFPDKPLINNPVVKFSAVGRKLMYLNAFLTGARVLIKKLLSTPDSSIIHGSPLKGVKKMCWSKPINLQVVKKIKNYTGTTVNDVLMACVSMSFHDYFKAHGISNPPDITACVPVDVRPKGEPLKLENNFAVISLKLPASKDGALENLYATKTHMDDVKHSGEAFVIAVGGNMAVEYIPEFITKLWNVPIANKHSLVLSNVPGPQESFSIDGHKVKQLMFAPPQRNLMGIGVGVITYAGEFSIGVHSDISCMTDPKWIVKSFESRIAQLEKCVVGANTQL